MFYSFLSNNMAIIPPSLKLQLYSGTEMCVLCIIITLIQEQNSKQ